MRKTPALAAMALAASLVLAGCGGESETEAYCDELRASIDEIGALDGTDGSALEEAFETIQEIADQAPEEVEEEWRVLADQMEQVQATIEDAGIQLSELENLGTELPEGVTEEDLRQLGEALQSLGTEEVQQASDTIAEHAQSECDVDLQNGTTGDGTGTDGTEDSTEE